MKILHLTLTRHWFLQIASGVKPVEYRLATNYWKRRLLVDGDPLKGYRSFDEIHFRNGYRKDSPFMRVKCEGIGLGFHSPYGENTPVYMIWLGEILEIRTLPGE